MGCGASTPAPPAADKVTNAKAEDTVVVDEKPAVASSEDAPELVAAAEEAMANSSIDMVAIFKQFDTSGDGYLQIGELQRAFRALGMEKRKGEKFELDQKTFQSFDTNGDGNISLVEFNANLHPKTRAKIEKLVTEGWTFDAEKWAASVERHAKWDMSKVFKQFDVDDDGSLSMEEFRRGFRAIGLKKRSGDKIEIDEAMFKAFDTNGDGVVSLAEFEANLLPATRKKLEEKLDAGWKFDPAEWAKPDDGGAAPEAAPAEPEAAPAEPEAAPAE